MGSSVRKLEIRIDQTGDAEKGIKNLSGAGGLAGLAGPAGLAVTAIAAVGAAELAAGAKLVQLGSDAEEMSSKFNVVFGTSAPQAQSELDAFGNAVGRSTFELMEMASQVQDTFVPLGFARDEAAGMSTQLTQLAVDMGSFNNVADADVMRDLQSAIVGNHETMRKYGVVITQATLDNELLRMGIEGGVRAATEQEKVQARLNLIMAGTSDAQGDAERTAGSWANQMRALKATLSETGTTIGLELLPFVTPLLQTVVEIATNALPPLLDAFKAVMQHLKTELGPVIQELIAAFQRVFQELGLNTGELDVLDIAVAGLKVTITLFAGFLKGFVTTLEGVEAGIRGIGKAVDWVVGKWESMKRAASDAINAIPTWLRPGSPTPFEIGLRGIGDAIDSIDLSAMGAPGVMPLAGAGVGNVNIYLTYSPAVSMGDRYEAESRLVPYIQRALQTARAM